MEFQTHLDEVRTSSYRCLARPQPGGSHSRRALCRTRRHPGTSSRGWWAPQSQPVPRHWGTPSISSETGIKNKKKRVRRRLTQERKRGFKKMLLHENVFCRKYIWDVLKIRTSVIAWWCGLRTKLSSLERCMKPSVLTLHFAVHQRQLLVWAARGLMPVPATFLFTMIRACHSVEDISFRPWRWDIAMQVLTCFCQY